MATEDNKLACLLDIDINRLDDYKLHLGVHNQKSHPLDLYVENNKNWKEWNKWYGGRNRWKNCKYILSFMQFHHEGRDVWLFGGIFEVKEPIPKGKKQGHFYNIDYTEQGKEFIGRLKIIYAMPGRTTYPYLRSSVYSKLKISEILKEPYSGAT